MVVLLEAVVGGGAEKSPRSRSLLMLLVLTGGAAAGEGFCWCCWITGGEGPNKSALLFGLILDATDGFDGTVDPKRSAIRSLLLLFTDGVGAVAAGSGAPKSRRIPSDCVGLEVAAAAGGGGVGVWLALRFGLDLAEEAPALAFLGGATGAAGSS